MMFRQNRGRHGQLKYLKGKLLDAKSQIRQLPSIVKKTVATILFVARGRHGQLKYLKGKWLTVKIQIRQLPLIVKKTVATIIIILFVAACTLCFISIKQSNNQTIKQ